ncbi:sigma-70 family RNA polymerase sigma factor [Thermoleophilia bacterium SCSIO 60948]|nr:sigma-70 family RNA polymerase sigma factor [Thermoleophilia bacterium SCSIO 60948]
MRRAREGGDAEALERLYDRHAVRAYRVAQSVCGDDAHAEEAVRIGFLRVWRDRARFDPACETFQSWSMQVVRSAATEVERRAPLQPSAAEEHEPDASQPESDELRRNESSGLRDALARLPEGEAEVISLAFFGELTHTEIAVQLGLPASTVKGRMRLGLEKLRAANPTVPPAG